MCSSLMTRAPSTIPLGPGTRWPVAFTVTSSKTSSGMFSGRYTCPGLGLAGMIMPGGPSLPASQVPWVSATTPSS